MSVRGLPIAPDPLRWHLAAIVAVMAYLAALGGLGLLALGDARSDWDRALGGALTVQLPAETSQARVEVVLGLLRQANGVIEAQALDAAAAARLLEPWLGKSVPVDILPLPLLVDVRIDPAAALDLDGLRARLKSVTPEAQLDDHRTWLVKLLSASAWLQAIAAALVAVAVAIAALSAFVAASGGLARNRERIALLHVLGAEDRDIAAPLVVPLAVIGLVGGALGALAAAGTWHSFRAIARSLGVNPLTPALTDSLAVSLLAAVALAGGVIAAAAAALVTRRNLMRLP